MKKVQLLEWGIITIGLIFGYKFFENFLTSLVQIIFSLANVNGGFDGDLGNYLLPLFFMLAVYGVCFIVLIKRSGQIASYLSGNSHSEVVPVKIGKKALLQVIIICICFSTVLFNIPDILLYLYESFKEKAGRYDPENNFQGPAQWHQFKLNALQVILALVLIYFSKDLSHRVLHRKEIDELSFESETPQE